MNELNMIRELLKEPPAPSRRTTAEALDRLEREMTGGGPRRRQRAWSIVGPRTASAHRLRWGLAVTAAGAAVAIGATAAVQQAGTRGPGTVGPSPSPGSTSAGKPMDSAQILMVAAKTVESRPAVRPKPHQWSYTKEISGSSVNRPVTAPGADMSAGEGPVTVERWIRFDGTREAYLGGNTPGVDPHHLHVRKLDHDSDETTPIQDHAYLESLPTDPDALMKRLCRGAPATLDRTQCVFPIAAKLLRDVAMPPRLQAAFFRVMAKVPHLVVKRDVVDLAGRHDIAVAEAYPGDFQSMQILLDPETYEYRGERTEWGSGPDEAPPGSGRTSPQVPTSPITGQVRPNYDETDRVASGVVDRPGLRP